MSSFLFSLSAYEWELTVFYLATVGFSFLLIDGCDVKQCYESLIGEIGFVDNQLVLPLYEDEELNLLCQ